MTADILRGRRVVIAADADYLTRRLLGEWLVDWATVLAGLGADVEVVSRFPHPDPVTDRLAAAAVHVTYPEAGTHDFADGAQTMASRVQLVAERAAGLDRHDVLLAQGAELASQLAATGLVAHCLWAMPLDDPLARLRLRPSLEQFLEPFTTGAKRVVVTDATAAGWVEGMAPTSLASRVQVWPTWAHRGEQAPAVGGARFLLHPSFTRPSHSALLAGWAEQLKHSDAPGVALIGDDADLAAFRASTGRQLSFSLPGLRIADGSGGQPVSYGLVAGSLAAPEDDTSFEAATWFEAHSVAPLVLRGSLADREGPAHWARFDGSTADLPPAHLSADQPPRSRADLAADLAHGFGQAVPVSTGGLRRKRVLLSGRDFKFAGELLSLIDGSADMDLLIDFADFYSSVEDRQVLADWADIIVCEFAQEQAVWHSRNVRDGQRLIIRLHGYELYSYAADIDISRCSAVVFVSEHHRQSAMEMYGWPEEKCHFIANAIDTVDLDRPKLGDVRFNLGMIGINPVLKRPERALDLLSRLRAEDDRYRLYLRGHLPWNYPWMWKHALHREPYLEFFRRLAGDDALSSAVSFEGFGPTIANWYRKVGWMLSPSQRESFHLAPADGMASGTVPVVWERLGAAAIFSERWTHASTEEAAQFILAVNQDPTAYAAESAAARARVGAFDFSSFSQKWLTLLRTAAPVGHTSHTRAAVRLPATMYYANSGEALQALWDSGAHSESRSALANYPGFVAKAELEPATAGAFALRRFAGLVKGWEALHPKLERALAHGPANSGQPAESALVVTAPGPREAAGWLSSVPGSRRLTVGPPAFETREAAVADVTDPGLPLDAYVDLVADRIATSARDEAHIVVVGPTWLASAAALAAQRLGRPLWWDLRHHPRDAAQIPLGQPYITPEPSPLYEAAYLAAQSCRGLVVRPADADPLLALNSLAGRVFPLGEESTVGSLWRGQRFPDLGHVAQDGPWNAMTQAPGAPRLALIGDGPAGLAEAVGEGTVDRVTEASPELHDALLVDARTPEAWAVGVPAIRKARPLSVPVLVWGQPQTGITLCDVVAVPGGVDEAARLAARPQIGYLGVPDDSADSVRMLLRAAGLESDAPAAPPAPTGAVGFQVPPVTLGVRVRGGDGFSSTLASLAGQTLHRRLFAVELDSPSAEAEGFGLRLEPAPEGARMVEVKAGETLPPGFLMGLWQE